MEVMGGNGNYKIPDYSVGLTTPPNPHHQIRLYQDRFALHLFMGWSGLHLQPMESWTKKWQTWPE